MRTLLQRFFFYIFFTKKGGNNMLYCLGVAQLILRGELKFSDIPEGYDIVRKNVKLILTTWGFPNLAEE